MEVNELNKRILSKTAMDIIVTTRRESGIPDEDILDLINRSYAVWKENGLDGPFMHYTLEEFRRETVHANVFVAVKNLQKTVKSIWLSNIFCIFVPK